MFEDRVERLIVTLYDTIGYISELVLDLYDSSMTFGGNWIILHLLAKTLYLFILDLDQFLQLADFFWHFSF